MLELSFYYILVIGISKYQLIKICRKFLFLYIIRLSNSYLTCIFKCDKATFIEHGKKL